MKNLFTLAAAGMLTSAAFSAQAQITLNGVIAAAEIGTGIGKYQSLGSFTTPHVSNGGFGNWGLLQMYAANGAANNGKLNLAVAGTLEKSGNGFQFYVDVPGVTGLSAGTVAPAPAPAASTMFDGIAGTKFDFDVDMGIALKGDAAGNVPQVVTYTSNTTANSRELSPVVPLTGGAVTMSVTTTVADYARFAGMRMAYKDTPSGSLVTDFPAPPAGPGGAGNPGLANGGGAGSYGWEVELSRSALNLPAGGGQVKVMSVYVSGGGYFSSDVIPEIAGNGNTNIGNTPDFTTQPGNQNASFTFTLSTKQEDEAAVAMSVFPNPSLSQATITYRVLDKAANVTVTISDLMGRSVRTLSNGLQGVGIQTMTLNNNDLATGTYLVKVQVGDKTSTRKVTLL